MLGILFRAITLHMLVLSATHVCLVCNTSVSLELSHRTCLSCLQHMCVFGAITAYDEEPTRASLHRLWRYDSALSQIVPTMPIQRRYLHRGYQPCTRTIFDTTYIFMPIDLQLHRTIFDSGRGARNAPIRSPSHTYRIFACTKYDITFVIGEIVYECEGMSAKV